jgi:hypothetical protein
VQALWVALLTVMRNYIPTEKHKYPTVEAFTAAYGGFFDHHNPTDLAKLWNTANMMVVLFTLIPSKKNKGLAIAIIPKVIEGWYAKYVTGSGQTKATADRVKIFETEGNVLPNQRGKLLKPKKKPSPTNSRRGSMSDEEKLKQKIAKRVESKRKELNNALSGRRRNSSATTVGEGSFDDSTVKSSRKSSSCSYSDEADVKPFGDFQRPSHSAPPALPKNVGVYNYLKDISRFSDVPSPSCAGSTASANDLTDNDVNDESADDSTVIHPHNKMGLRDLRERSNTEEFDRCLDIGNFVGLEEEPAGPMPQEFLMEFDENDSDFVDVLGLLRNFSNTNMALKGSAGGFNMNHVFNGSSGSLHAQGTYSPRIHTGASGHPHGQRSYLPSPLLGVGVGVGVGVGAGGVDDFMGMPADHSMQPVSHAFPSHNPNDPTYQPLQPYPFTPHVHMQPQSMSMSVTERLAPQASDSGMRRSTSQQLLVN